MMFRSLLFFSAVYPLTKYSMSSSHLNDGLQGIEFQFDSYFFLSFWRCYLNVFSFLLFPETGLLPGELFFLWWHFALFLCYLLFPLLVMFQMLLSSVLQFPYVISRWGFAFDDAKRMDRRQHASSIWGLLSLWVYIISPDCCITGVDLDPTAVHGKSWMDANFQVSFLKKEWRLRSSAFYEV